MPRKDATLKHALVQRRMPQLEGLGGFCAVVEVLHLQLVVLALVLALAAALEHHEAHDEPNHEKAPHAREAANQHAAAAVLRVRLRGLLGVEARAGEEAARGAVAPGRGSHIQPVPHFESI